MRYARSGGVDIAYKVAGTGPPDLVLVPGLIDVIEAESVYAPIRRLTEHVRRYARLIRLDKRGTGFSERLPADAAPSLEDRVDDVIAVMDAAGSERATVLGVADGGAVAIVLAVTHPERVSALVLNATPPRIAWSPEWPWGIPREAQDAGSARHRRAVGDGRHGRPLRHHRSGAARGDRPAGATHQLAGRGGAA